MRKRDRCSRSFDVDTLQLTGRAVPAVEGVTPVPTTVRRTSPSPTAARWCISPATRSCTRAPIRWIDRTGKIEPLRDTPSDWTNPSFALDGRRLAVDISDGGQTDVWVYEWARDTMSRLTFDPADDARPVWSPGSTRHIHLEAKRRCFQSVSATRRWDRRRRASDRKSEPAVPVFMAPKRQVPRVLRDSSGQGHRHDDLPLDGDESTGWKPGKPYAFLSSRFTESGGMFSPDGRWIAYMSNESGRNDIYVRPSPGPGGKWQVAASPGDDPTWSRASREFFFLNTADLRLMSVAYRVEGDSFQADKPVVWLNTRLNGRPRAPSRNLDLHPDGKRSPSDRVKKGRRRRKLASCSFSTSSTS